MPIDTTALDDFYNSYAPPVLGESPDHEAAPPPAKLGTPDFSKLYNPVHDAIAGIGSSFNGTVTPPQLSGTSNTTSTSAGVSVGSSGLDRDTFEYVDTKGKKGFQADVAAAKNDAATQYNALSGEAGAAAATQKDATIKQGDAVAARADAEATLTARLAEQEKQNAIKDQEDYALVQVKTQKYMADYERSLTELTTMSVNPGRAYSMLSGNERAGVKITAFITDFLGAKGIKSSGMDYINRGIDMDIQAQKDAISLQKDVVSGKQNLWSMQRLQSQSDYEATVRTRGALLSAAKTEMQAKLASFDSPIARAKAAEAAALIDQELVKTRSQLTQMTNTHLDNQIQVASANRSASLQAGAASQRAAIDKEELAFKKEQYADAKKAADGQQYEEKLFVRDTGGTVAIMAPNEATRNKLQEQVTASELSIKDLHKLLDDITVAGKTYQGFGKEWFAGYAEAEYGSRYNQLLSNLILAQTGKAANKEEVERLKEVLPISKLGSSVFSGEDGAKVVQRVLAARGIDKVESLLDTVRAQGIPVPPEIAARYKGGITPGAFEATKARGQDLTIINKDEPSPTAKADESVGDAQQWKRNQPVAVSKESPVYDYAVEFFDSQQRDLPEFRGNKLVPTYFNEMANLSTIINDPQESDANKDRAVEFLTNKANPRKGRDYLLKPDEHTYEEQAAAQYFLMKMAETPNAQR